MSIETLAIRAPDQAIVITRRSRGYAVRRYYDPGAGQFISVDPLVDQTEAPYAYAEDDPVDGLDPLGLYPGQSVVHGVENAAVGTANCLGDVQHCLSPRGVANAATSFFNTLWSVVTDGQEGPGLPTPYPCDQYVGESSAFGQGVFIAAGFALPGFDEADVGALGAEEGAPLDATPAGRVYTAHYLRDTGGVRNIPGSVVDETIDYGQAVKKLPDRTIYYDAKNDVTVVQSDTTGKIMSVRRGTP